MYTTTIELEDHEVAAKIDMITGKVQEIKRKKVNNGMFKFNLMPTYKKYNSGVATKLKPYLTCEERSMIPILADMARHGSNSLIPLNDKTTNLELADMFGIDRRKVRACVNKLFEVGVLGKFEGKNHDDLYKNYWILNPYIYFNGGFAKDYLKDIFHGIIHPDFLEKMNPQSEA